MNPNSALVELEELRLSLQQLRKTTDEEMRKTADYMRRKDVAIKDLVKEVDQLKTGAKQTKKAGDETRRFFRETLSAEIAKLREEMQAEFEQAMKEGDKEMKKTVNEVITKKFEQGFSVIEKECRGLFQKISDDMDMRALKNEAQCESIITDRVQEAEADINSRCRDMISVRLNLLEYQWRSMNSKVFSWALDSFQERMLLMYNQRETTAVLCSPVFTLAMCPRMCVEIQIENVSRGEHHNEWLAGGGGAGTTTAGSFGTTTGGGPRETSNGEGEDRVKSIIPVPVAGNMNVRLFLQTPLDILKLRITAGPPDMEIVRVVTHADLMKVEMHADDQHRPDAKGARRNDSSEHAAQAKSRASIDAGSKALMFTSTGGASNRFAGASAVGSSMKGRKESGALLKRGDAVKHLFEAESTLVRKHDPLDMVVDLQRVV